MKRRRQSQREEKTKCGPVAPSVEYRQDFQLFPNYSVHVIMFVVLLGRLTYVTDPSSWWTLHPDEIYQVTEVAHADVYGFGFASSGYQRPLYSEYGLNHARESMRGINSWILPKFYSWSLFCKEALKIPTRPYLFCRQLHTVVSGLLPASVFFLCRRLHPDWPSDVASIAALVVGFGDYFVLLGTHTLPQTLLSAALFAVAALMYKKEGTRLEFDTNGNYDFKDSRRSAVIGGPDDLALLSAAFLQSVVCYMKPDAVVLVVLLNLLLFSEWQIRKARSFLSLLAGSGLGVTLCGYFDLIYYGSWFVSPVRWVLFEWRHAGQVFGETGMEFYFEKVFLTAGAHVVMAVSCFVVVTLYVIVTRTSALEYRELCLWALQNRDSVVMSFKLGFCSLCLISIHSFQPHKDMRYIHDALVLLSCSGAGALFCLYQLLKVLSERQQQDKVALALKLFVYAEAVLCAVRVCSPAAMNTRFADMTELVIPDTPQSWHVNRCLDFVGRQPDLRGLVLDHPIHLSGGYTVLHSNVPVIAKTHFDFREWDFRARTNFTSDTAFSFYQSLSSFERISNYVAEENGKLVLALASQSGSAYNYAVLTRRRRFPKQGFREVFASGNVTVFRRMKQKSAVEYLEGLVKQIPLGKDAGVLQVEAAWLIAFGLPTVAEARLQRALEVDKTCLACWQLLHRVYLDLRRPEMAEKAGKECVDVLGTEKCASKSKIVPLHPGYSLGISRPVQPKPIVLQNR